MDKDSNLKHWNDWAESHGISLLATTKCQTIKKIEVMALARALRKYLGNDQARILEIGCGNGINIFQLGCLFPDNLFYGLDFSEKMIANARKAASGQEETLPRRLPARFGVSDARELSVPLSFEDGAERVPAFDAIFTNRMLINLASTTEQMQVMRKIAGALRPGGLFLMLENSVQSHARLNEVRVALGLTERASASYNIFIDEDNLIEPFRKEMDLVQTDYISGIHDLMLYAVCPATDESDVQYDTPLMKNLAEAVIRMGEIGLQMPKGFGQGVLWVWQKRGK